MTLKILQLEKRGSLFLAKHPKVGFMLKLYHSTFMYYIICIVGKKIFIIGVLIPQ